MTALAEHIRREIAAHRVRLPDGRALSVTASFGAAQFSPEDAPTEFLQRADDALYRAKRSGRNRVCRADSRLALAEVVG